MDLVGRTTGHLIADGLIMAGSSAPVEKKDNVGYYSHVPSKLYGLLDAMYRSACVQHNVILCREHLAQHGRSFNLRKLLEVYQMKRRRNQVNRILGGLTDQIRDLGRRFSSRAMLARPGPAEDRE